MFLVAPEESHFPVDVRHSPTSTDHRSPVVLAVNFEEPLPDSEIGGPAHGQLTKPHRRLRARMTRPKREGPSYEHEQGKLVPKEDVQTSAEAIQ